MKKNDNQARNRSSMVQILTNRSFKHNKGRNLVAVMAIILTTLMFTTLFVLTQSMSKTLVEMTFRQTGNTSHASTKSITDEQIEKIAAHPDVVSYGRSIVVGLAENKKLMGRQVEIRYGDDTYAENGFSLPTTGRMPQSDDEIALDDIALKRLGVPMELGQKVQIEWRKDLTKDEFVTSEFTLCGFWEGNTSVYASMAWVSEGFAKEMAKGADLSQSGQVRGLQMMEISFKNDKNLEASVHKVLQDTGITDVEFNVNLAYNMGQDTSQLAESLPMYGGMILVFISGYLIIYNIFQISVAADIQFYGKLKTLGTSKKQISKLIYGQANRLCLIGIPVGLILGYLLGSVLVPMMIASSTGEASLSSSPVIFIGSAVFAWLTVRISCARPAKLAGKVSPMEALRYTDVEPSGKGKKKSRSSVSIGAMAFSNLGRNKKRTITVICSLTLGLVLLSAFYAQNASFDMDKYLNSLVISDFQVDEATNKNYMGSYDPYGKTISQDLLRRIEEAGGVTGRGRLYSQDMVISLSEQAKSNIDSFYHKEPDRIEWLESDEVQFGEFNTAMETGEIHSTVYGIDGIALDALVNDGLLMDGAIDKDLFASGNYIVAHGPAAEGMKETWPTFSIGEKVQVGTREFEVMAVVESPQPIAEGVNASAFSLQFYIPADIFTELYPENTLRKYYWNVEEDAVEAHEKMLEDYIETVDSQLTMSSRSSIAQKYREETRASGIMGNAVSIVIAIVGVLNFINSMVTSIVSRRKEFAMIQSVGMTKSQLRRMLTFEGLDYALITLAASYLLSSVVIGTVIRAITTSGWTTTYHFTLLPLIICTPILLVLAVLIPYICFKNIEKQSIVERLRIT